jgi:hypothetical protein
MKLIFANSKDELNFDFKKTGETCIQVAELSADHSLLSRYYTDFLLRIGNKYIKRGKDVWSCDQDKILYSFKKFKDEIVRKSITLKG